MKQDYCVNNQYIPSLLYYSEKLSCYIVIIFKGVIKMLLELSVCFLGNARNSLLLFKNELTGNKKIVLPKSVNCLL